MAQYPVHRRCREVRGQSKSWLAMQAAFRSGTPEQPTDGVPVFNRQGPFDTIFPQLRKSTFRLSMYLFVSSTTIVNDGESRRFCAYR